MARIGDGQRHGGSPAGLVRDGARGKGAQRLAYPFLELLVAPHAA